VAGTDPPVRELKDVDPDGAAESGELEAEECAAVARAVGQRARRALGRATDAVDDGVLGVVGSGEKRNQTDEPPHCTTLPRLIAIECRKPGDGVLPPPVPGLALVVERAGRDQIPVVATNQRLLGRVHRDTSRGKEKAPPHAVRAVASSAGASDEFGMFAA